MDTLILFTFIEAALIWMLNTVWDELLLWTLTSMDTKMLSNFSVFSAGNNTILPWQSVFLDDFFSSKNNFALQTVILEFSWIIFRKRDILKTDSSSKSSSAFPKNVLVFC